MDSSNASDAVESLLMLGRGHSWSAPDPEVESTKCRRFSSGDVSRDEKGVVTYYQVGLKQGPILRSGFTTPAL
jgi:hypothetical protein